MSTPSIEECRECAENLRGMSSFKFTPINWPVLMGTLGVNSREGALMALAEMVDPTPWERTVEDNHRLIDRCRELEIENSRLKARLAKEEIRWEA